MTYPPVNYQPYAPPVPASAYGAGGGHRPPNRAKVNWLWVLILVCIVAAVVKFSVAPNPSPAPPTISYTPTATTTQPSMPSATTSQAGAFCLNYYVFSIDVTTSWQAFGTAVAKRDAAGALTMVKQYHSEAQAMQQANPPNVLKIKLETVLSGLQTAQDVLSTGSVSGLADVDAMRADITALQTAADGACR